MPVQREQFARCASNICFLIDQSQYITAVLRSSLYHAVRDGSKKMLSVLPLKLALSQRRNFSIRETSPHLIEDVLAQRASQAQTFYNNNQSHDTEEHFKPPGPWSLELFDLKFDAPLWLPAAVAPHIIAFGFRS